MSDIPADIKTEEEARKWLMSHGYGIGMIDDEMANWTPPAAPAPKEEPKAAPVPKEEPKAAPAPKEEPKAPGPLKKLFK